MFLSGLLTDLTDAGVRPNGFTSPDLPHDEDDDNDDCSSHASSSDWTPQPQIGKIGWFYPQLSALEVCFVSSMKAWFSSRLVSVHSAAHHERNRPEGHPERPAPRNGPPGGSGRHDAVADHHQHLRAAQKKETQRRQHARGRRAAPEGEEEDSGAHGRRGASWMLSLTHTHS